MQKNYILLQAYGNQGVLDECLYCVLTFVKKASEWSKKNITIIIFTDTPTTFKKLDDCEINLIVEVINAEQIRLWRGEIDFVHRVKIKVIERFFSKYEGNMLYLDTDTYFLKDAQSLFERIENGEILMDSFDGRLDQGNNLLIKKIYNKFLKNAIIFNGNIKISGSLEIWVAGVMGFNNKLKHIIPEVLALTDELYKQHPKHIMEQIAFCFYLQKHGKINTTNDTIFHYWNFKEFRDILKEFFEKLAEKDGKTLSDLTEKIQPSIMMKPKMDYESLSFFRKAWRKTKKKRWEMPLIDLS